MASGNEDSTNTTCKYTGNSLNYTAATPTLYIGTTSGTLPTYTRTGAVYTVGNTTTAVYIYPPATTLAERARAIESDRKSIADKFKEALEQAPPKKDPIALLIKYRVFMNQDSLFNNVNHIHSISKKTDENGRHYLVTKAASSDHIYLSADDLDVAREEWSKSLKKLDNKAKEKDRLQVIIDISIPGDYDE